MGGKITYFLESVRQDILFVSDNSSHGIPVVPHTISRSLLFLLEC